MPISSLVDAWLTCRRPTVELSSSRSGAVSLSPSASIARSVPPVATHSRPKNPLAEVCTAFVGNDEKNHHCNYRANDCQLHQNIHCDRLR